MVEFETMVKIGCTDANDVLNPKLRLGLNMYSKEVAANSMAAQAKTTNASQAAALKALTSKAGQSEITLQNMFVILHILYDINLS